MSDIGQSTDSIREELEDGNLDAKVSNAGATDTDIRDGVWSDSTKAPGANVDASISTRATQSDILSDATPFDGANIDAAISSVGGVDWASKTSTYSRGYASSTDETFFSVSGSGYIAAINVNSNAAGADQFYLTIDGTDIFNNNTINGMGMAPPDSLPMFYRFNSSFELRNGSSNGFTMGGLYVLD